MSQSSKNISKSQKNKKDKFNFKTISAECQGSKYYLDPQLISKRKVGINTSTSKQMYKFNKAIRFKSYKKPYDALYYDLPSVKDRFTTTFGYGKKFDFSKNVLKGKTDSYYDIPREFDLRRKNSPQFSFGKGRDLCIMPQFKIKKETPGVGAYELRKDFGKDALKFSIFGREWDHRKISPMNAFITPGPGYYEEVLKTNDKGKYSSSIFENTKQVKFIGPERDKKLNNNNPPPWAYNLGTMFNRTGMQFTSKFNSTIAKTMSNRPKEFYLPDKKSTFPGPGSYNSFSEFNGYTENNKKCKCGRDLGHPPIFNENCDKKYSKTLSVDDFNRNDKKKNISLKKKINLKIDTSLENELNNEINENKKNDKKENNEDKTKGDNKDGEKKEINVN